MQKKWNNDIPQSTDKDSVATSHNTYDKEIVQNNWNNNIPQSTDKDSGATSHNTYDQIGNKYESNNFLI